MPDPPARLEGRKAKVLTEVLRRTWTRSGMFAVFVAMAILSSVFVPYFFTVRNMIGLALSVTTIGMVASTMLFVLAAGDLDLSVGSIVSFAGIIAATALNRTESVPLGILAGVQSGFLVGCLNGTLVAGLKLNPLISTLATMQMVRGAGMIVSGGTAVGVTLSGFFVLGTGTVLGIPNPVWLTLVVFIIFGILLNNTIYGRNILAVGGNREAARLAGINVGLTRFTAFALQGAVAGFAGVILASRMASGQPNAAWGMELDVISACVLGGVSLSGGVATVQGLFVGVLIMGSVQNVLNLLNVQTFYQYVIRGSILILAIVLDRLRSKA